MSSNGPFPSLHDWSLIGVDSDWESSSATVRLLDESGPRKLVGLQLCELNILHHSPWGPSKSINKVEGPTRGIDGAFTLKIQMQSGDMIVLVAGSFEVR
jgi:hypothetical protein